MLLIPASKFRKRANALAIVVWIGVVLTKEKLLLLFTNVLLLLTSYLVDNCREVKMVNRLLLLMVRHTITVNLVDSRKMNMNLRLEVIVRLLLFLIVNMVRDVRKSRVGLLDLSLMMK